MKKIKENKGITLIALIITIIVLLILAIVAISAVQGDGIIAHAKNARDNYKDAQDTENTLLGNYMVQLNEANEQGTNLQEDGNEEEIVSGQISLAAGSTIPSGYFYMIITDELENGFEADCYAASEAEIANNTITYDGGLVLNYKGSTMPEADTFENGGSLCCMNTGLIFECVWDEDEENIIGLSINVDESIQSTFTSISTINNMINDGISIYGYDQVKSVSLFDCTAIVDASTLNISGFTDMADAFSGCTSLTKVPTIPTTVTKIEDCFKSCTSLTEVTYAGTVAQFKQIGKYYDCGDAGLIVHCSDGDYTVVQ